MQLIVKDAPVELVGAILADAQARDVTFQEAVASVLCDRFGVRRVASDRKFVSGTQGGTELHLEVPLALRTKLRRRAASIENGTMRGVVLSALAEHYELPAIDPGRRPRS